MTEFNLNLNVKIDAPTLGDAYIKMAGLITDLQKIGEVTKADISDRVRPSGLSGGTCREEHPKTRSVRV